MKIYVINLDRRPERLTFFRDQADSLGISFNRITAVDGQDPSIAERSARLSMGFSGTHLGAMQLACLESHRKAWRHVIDGDEQFSIVMEDDVVLHKNFKTLLVDDWVPRDADLVRLETYLTAARFDRLPIGTVGDRTIWRLRSTIFGTGAYIISRQAAHLLLRTTDNRIDAVDLVMFSQSSPLFSRLVIYQLIPAPAIQGDRQGELRQHNWARSEITEEREKTLSQAAIGMRKYKLWWRINYWLKPIIARLKGFRMVPYG